MKLPEVVAVLGLGISGCAVAEALIKRGSKVIGADEAPKEKILQREQVKQLVEKGIELVSGEGAFMRLAELGLKLAILSPGISIHREDIKRLAQSGTKLIGEVEFSYQLLVNDFGREKVCIVAVTGTKGKTTTVHLIWEMLKSSGLTTILAGNVGTPLAMFVDELPRSEAKTPIRVVMEVSSFQLATCETFRPDIAALTTLFVDHLDWHLDAEDYRRSKAKIFANQKGEDWAVLNADNLGVRWMAQFVRSRVLWCGKEVASSCPYCTHWVSNDDEIVWASLNGERFPVARLSEFMIRGEHNHQNLQVAIGSALLAGAHPEAIADVVRNFKGVPHRLELVGEINGIRFVNDSAATTPDSAAAGIQSFDAPVVLIAGGRDKGGNWDGFRKAMKEQVKVLVVIGEFADKLIEMAKEAKVKFTKAEDMEDAVRKAFELASSGDVVLLSPGCASFDMFTSYAQRGEKFKEAVCNLLDALHLN
ncbi:MAG: UDP-N-acetylmuramoyl-L-alanine--D-glutamate ligase [Armatimonadetes bacterium]|nr:UDP-N-acetylmuramoyl-L-alanine--D-glutamate ligase [Armatimonadota bacterium]MDW8029012.1 UDP-N-acetylmuramoyl-L-alanine--D-glutamate ligase [Armatimonadota bacterium]